MREELKKFGILILTFSLIIGLCSGIEVQADSDKLPVFTNQPVFSEYNPNTDKFEGNPTGTSSYSIDEYVWLDYEECDHGNGYDMNNVKKVIISSNDSTDIEAKFSVYPVINVIRITTGYDDNLVSAYKSGSMKVRVVFNDDMYIESDVIINNENYLSNQISPKSDGTFGTLITALNYSEYLKMKSLDSLYDSLPKYFDSKSNKMYVDVNDLQGGLSIPKTTRKVMLRDNDTGNLTTLYSNGGVNISNDFKYTMGYFYSRGPGCNNFYKTIDRAQLPLLMNNYVRSDFTIPYEGAKLKPKNGYFVGQSFSDLSWEEFYNQCKSGEGVMGAIYKYYGNNYCYKIECKDHGQEGYDDAPNVIKNEGVIYKDNLEEVNKFLKEHPDFKYRLVLNNSDFNNVNKLDSSNSNNYIKDNPDYLTCVPYLTVRCLPNDPKIVNLLDTNKDKLIGNKCSLGQLEYNKTEYSLNNSIGLSDIYYEGLLNYSVNKNGLPVGITTNDLQSLYKAYFFMYDEDDAMMYVNVRSDKLDELKSKFTEDELNSIHPNMYNESVTLKDFDGSSLYVDLKQITGETAIKFLDNYELDYNITFYRKDPNNSSESIINFLRTVSDNYNIYSIYYDRIDNSYRQWSETLLTEDNVDSIINNKLGATIEIKSGVGLDISSVYPSDCFSQVYVYLNPYIKSNGGFPEYDKVVTQDELSQSEEYSKWLDLFYDIYPQFKDYNSSKCDDTKEYGQFVNDKFVFNDKFFNTFELGKSYSLVIQDVTIGGGLHTLEGSKNNTKCSTFIVASGNTNNMQKLSSGLNFDKWNEFGDYSVYDYFNTFMDFYEWDYADIIPASAPSEPRNLNSSLDGRHIEVSWDSPDNEGLGQNSDGTAKTDDVIKVDEYKVSVYKVDDSASSSTLVKEDVVNSTRLNTDIPVSEKGTYRVLISASNLIGEGSHATLLINNENTPVKPDPDPTPVNPDPEPTLELASPSIITTSSDVSSITMDWEYKGELKPEGYKVAIKEVGTDSELDWNTVSNETFSKTFTNLKSNTEYEVYVKAYKGSDESAYDFRVITTKEELIEPTPSDDPEPTPSEEPTPSDDPEPTPSEEPTPSDDPEPTPSEDKLPKPIITDVKTTKTTLDVKWEYNYSKEPNYFEVGISDEVTKLPTKWDTVNKDSREHEFTDLKEGTKYYVFVRAVFDEGITDDDSEGKTISTDVIDLTNHNSEGSSVTRTGDESNGRLIIKILIGSLYVMVGVMVFRLKNKKKQVR